SLYHILRIPSPPSTPLSPLNPQAHLLRSSPKDANLPSTPTLKSSGMEFPIANTVDKKAAAALSSLIHMLAILRSVSSSGEGKKLAETSALVREVGWEVVGRD
ncbi:hypothetical protein HK097_002611, partial [Rhizophlyctis rosea]